MMAFYAAARAMLKAGGFHMINWRHHGLGMLQSEVTDDIRIHVWHPELRTIPTDSLRSVHDHRFDIMSAVLIGEIEDVPWQVSTLRAFQRTSTNMFAIKHAKIQDGVADDVTPLGEVWAAARTVRRFQAGEVYTIDRRVFHQTIVHGLAVTVVYRSGFDNEPARVLGHADPAKPEPFGGHKPIESGIVRDHESRTLRLRILAEAEEAIGESFG
jgi:hypothetical protein